MLDANSHALDHDILLETIEFAAFKVLMPADGACIFTGRTAIYTGPDQQFDGGKGHVLLKNIPLAVCDKTAGAIEHLGRDDVVVTPTTGTTPAGGVAEPVSGE